MPNGNAGRARQERDSTVGGVSYRGGWSAANDLLGETDSKAFMVKVFDGVSPDSLREPSPSLWQMEGCVRTGSRCEIVRPRANLLLCRPPGECSPLLALEEWAIHAVLPGKIFIK